MEEQAERPEPYMAAGEVYRNSMGAVMTLVRLYGSPLNPGEPKTLGGIWVAENTVSGFKDVWHVLVTRDGLKDAGYVRLERGGAVNAEEFPLPGS